MVPPRRGWSHLGGTGCERTTGSPDASSDGEPGPAFPGMAQSRTGMSMSSIFSSLTSTGMPHGTSSFTSILKWYMDWSA